MYSPYFEYEDASYFLQENAVLRANGQVRVFITDVKGQDMEVPVSGA